MSTPESTAVGTPPLPPQTDTEAIRRRLAGLADPGRLAESRGELAEIREIAARLCSTLASLFGEELDRITLWDRIDSALTTALSRAADGDLDRFVSTCLEHVKAAPSRAAASEPLSTLLDTFAVRPPEWRQALLAYLATHRYAVLARGRARWEEIKAGRIEP